MPRDAAQPTEVLPQDPESMGDVCAVLNDLRQRANGHGQSVLASILWLVKEEARRIRDGQIGDSGN